MCCHIINFSSTSCVVWIATAKDIALIILSFTAIMFGYIQSQKAIRTEWIKYLRIEIAKLISTSTRTSVSLNDFNKETSESVSLINLYLDDNNVLHNKLLHQINALIDLWLAHHSGSRKNEKIDEYINNVNQTTKSIIKTEQQKLFS